MIVLPSNIKYLVNDSRQLTSPQDSVFFAIKGPHHDGHIFVKELYNKGLRYFVVESQVDLPSDAQVFFVANTIKALQEIATFHRQKYSLPVIAISGSNGKTIVKEWLYQLLNPDYEIVRSPKSYNSQIGVPLSVWQIKSFHTLGIFEAGVSQPSEMENSEKVIKPTIGIFTNLGSAHDEGFENKSHKLSEKLKLYKNVKCLITKAGNSDIANQIKTYLKAENPSCKLIEWQNVPFDHPFVDAASIENLGHCVALMQYLAIDNEVIRNRIQLLKPLSMRLQMKEGINGCYILDDTYNNDFGGLKNGLDFLQNQNQRSHKVVILSDLLQTGIPENDLYQQIAKLLKDKGVNQIIGIGELISRNQNYFAPPAKFYANTEEFLSKMRHSDFLQSVILVKGARKFQLERIVKRIEKKTHGTFLEINLDAISENLNYFREKLKPQTKIMVMVKAFAYGSGSAEVANLLQFHRVDYLAVAYVDEGVFLRENGIKTPIMVMNPSETSFEKLVVYQLEPEIYSHKLLDAFVAFLETNYKVAKCHLKLDTGMKRLGFELSEIDLLLEKIKSQKSIEIVSVFSHLVGADEENLDYFTALQLNLFEQMVQKIEKNLAYPIIKHLSNSAGIARFTDMHLDMVRLGIGLYGIGSTEEDQKKLKTVGTLKTEISQIKNINIGESVGYGRQTIALKNMKTATIAIGYADGFDRGFSKGIGKVLINNKLCPVVGNVCMDMTMVDITEIEAKEGDEVIIFGENPTVQSLAERISTIPYEILTGVSERVKRVFYST